MFVSADTNTMFSRKYIHGLTIALALLFTMAVASGQETTGSLRGVVTDATGAVVPNAKVEVAGPALLGSPTVTTDSAGTYAFLTLPSGVYTLTATASGFIPQKRVNIDLQVGKILRIDFKLEVGGTQQTIEVISEAPIVDVSQSTVSANVTQLDYNHLPKGRSFDSLIALAPGARYEATSGGYQVDGASGSENIYVIDGMDTTDLYTGGLPSTAKIPTEFVQETQIKSSGFMAEYGGAMGGVINVVSKSGSNQFHGDLGIYGDSDVLQAGPHPTQDLNPVDDNIVKYIPNTRDGYRFINPVVDIGGPILKDKIWFFAGWSPEFHRYDRQVTFNIDNSTDTFVRDNRYDFMQGKIDAAPFSKLHTYVGYLYSPRRQNGTLPSLAGTDDPNNPWGDLGNRTAAASYTFGADYTATSKLIFSVRGGYNYWNYKSYGVPSQAAIYYSPGTASQPFVGDIPAQWQAGSGWVQQANTLWERNIQTRYRTNADVSYIANWHGQHTFKGGWEVNRLHNDPNESAYAAGYLRYFWGGTYTALDGSKMSGKYGYLRYRYYGTSGNVSSANQSLFFQDSWQVRPGLTLLLGVRTEREFVPSFATADNIPSHAITFGFGQKLAPRLGFAWDIKGDSRWKLAGSFGLFYDLMKYAMPQGSFGGQKYDDYFYPLDNPDPSTYIPLIPLDGGIALDAPLQQLSLVDHINWRIPSNDPSDNTIDPNLKPMRRRVYDVSLEHALTPTLAMNVRYTHNSMDRAIEDVGTLSPAGEKYYIANPGFGITVDPATWGPGYPLTPKAKRNYDAVEFRLDKRFAENYMFAASYTWSRQFGNYSGLASSDEPSTTDNTGRQDPNVSRYFDLPYMSYDSHGNLVEGLLATDRPHTFKFFGAYTWKNKLGETSFGPNFLVYSGTPLTTQVNMVSSVPIYVNGRGDLGRTPIFSQTDIYVYHEFKATERLRFKIDMNISNVFNQDTVVAQRTDLLNRNDATWVGFDDPVTFFQGFDYKAMIAQQEIRSDAGFGLPTFWQKPRDMRFGFKVIF